MAFDKVIDSAALNAGMTATANAIREKAGSTDPIVWDSVNGFKEAVDQIDIKQGIELPVLGDASAKPTDMAFGKILYDDSGNPVVGTLVESKAGTNEMITATEFYGNSQGDTTFSFSGIYSVNHTEGVDPQGFICRPGTNFVLKNIPTALFGNATPDQVARGVTFTSASGLLIEGVKEDVDCATYSEYDDVCFWDYDGTLLYSCTLEEAQKMTELPAIPDHSNDVVPLTSQGWNYTLEEINALTRKADIGAIYNPTDGKTHFTLRMDERTGLTCTTQFYMYDGGTMHVDWGDGTIDTDATARSYSAYLTHTYAEPGEYNVTIWCEGSTWTPYKQCICNEAPETIVGTFVLGTDISCWWLQAFLQNSLVGVSVDYIVWPNLYEEQKDFSSSGGTAPIADAPYLKHFNIPRGVISGVPSFKNCTNLKRVSVPESATASMDYFCAGCYCMDRLCLPNGWVNKYAGTIAQRFLLENFCGDEWVYHFEPSYRDLYMSYTLRKLTVKENVTTVHGNTWCQNCPLEDIYLYPTTPPTLSTVNGMFAKIRKNTKIHVPVESLDAYQTATNWSTWANYMVGDL